MYTQAVEKRKFGTNLTTNETNACRLRKGRFLSSRFASCDREFPSFRAKRACLVRCRVDSIELFSPCRKVLFSNIVKKMRLLRTSAPADSDGAANRIAGRFMRTRYFSCFHIGGTRSARREPLAGAIRVIVSGSVISWSTAQSGFSRSHVASYSRRDGPSQASINGGVVGRDDVTAISAISRVCATCALRSIISLQTTKTPSEDVQ